MPKTIFKRGPIRFKPDPMTVALIDFNNSKDFTPQSVGIVVNESYTGCAVVIAFDRDLKKGDKIKIKVGQLAEMKASIVWVKNFEENIFKVGVHFLD